MSDVSSLFKRGVLVLEEKTGQQSVQFSGYLFGAPVSLELIQKKKDYGYGEVVFNTAMTGYQEILTDPSYYGQMICMTTPHIGNTGINDEDPESNRLWCSGFIVHQFTETPSNWRSQDTLDNYLKKNQIPGLFGVDTRALTRHLRTLGVARGVILPLKECNEAGQLLAKLPPFEGRDLIAEVSTNTPFFWPFNQSWKTKTANSFNVVALDFGIKWNLLRNLEERGCRLEVLPCNTGAKEILQRNPDGVFLSNGPGDPMAAPYAAATVRALLGKIPIFGVCMGHQILALALGAKTYKLKFGHRGGNQPVFDKKRNHVEISSHNHGYAVNATTLPPQAVVTHINLNDRTVEGLEVPGLMAFSVQYHPEACPGPHDATSLFDRFIEMIEDYKKRQVGSKPERTIPGHVSKVP